MDRSARNRAHIACALLLVSIVSACGGGGGSGQGAPAPSSQTITSSNGKQLTIQSDAGTVANAAPIAGQPGGASSSFNYPVGFFNYNVTGLAPGQKVNVTITLPAGSNPTTYMKCGTGTSAACSALAAGEFQISGNTVTLTLTDGGPGDADGKADGVITDPGAPAVPVPTPSYWLAYTGNDGSNNFASQLFAAPSNSLSATPTVIESSAVATLVPQYLTNNLGQVYAQVPFSVFYSNGSNHYYSADLNDATKALAPRQLTTLTAMNCAAFNALSSSSFFASVNAADPTSTFFLVDTDPSGQCPQLTFAPGSSSTGPFSDKVYLLHYSDTPSTSATLTPVSNLPHAPVISFVDTQTGHLSGLLASDAFGNLTWYPDSSFANTKVLLSGVVAYSIIEDSPGFAFIAVQRSGSAVISLYRVSASGAISADLYDFQASDANADCYATQQFSPCAPAVFGGAISPDGRQMYFGDNQATFDSATGLVATYSDRLVRVAADGSSAAEVAYTFAGGAPPGKNAQGGATFSVEIEPFGFIGNRLVFAVEAPGRSGDGYPASIDSLDAASPAGSTPTVISSLADGYYGHDILENSLILVTAHPYDPATGNALYASAQAIQLDGTVIQSLAHSWFYGGTSSLSGTPANPLFTPADSLVLSGYTAAQPSTGKGRFDLGGGTLVRYSGTDFSAIPTPITVPGGQALVFQSMEQILTSNSYADPIGGAMIFGPSAYAAAALDLVNNELVVLTGTQNDTNDNVLFY
jgi:hypothetical protein